MTLSKLRSMWRSHLAVKVGQVWRFVRVTVVVLVGQVVTQAATNGDFTSITHLDQKAVVALLAGAAETAWRQLHPVVTVSDAMALPTPTDGGSVPVEVGNPGD